MDSAKIPRDAVYKINEYYYFIYIITRKTA